MSSEDIPIEIAVAPNPVIGETWRQLLADYGIPSTILSTDALASAYLISSPSTCIITVPGSQAERAKSILKELIGDMGDWEVNSENS